MKNEIWKQVKGFPGYEVSNLGNIKSFFGKISDGRKFTKVIVEKSIFLKKHKNTSGYYVVDLSDKSKLVSRLVAENFIENRYGKKEVNHINGDKLDNRVENLEWVTHQENIDHAWNKMLMRTKLNLRQVNVIRSMKKYKGKISQSDIGKIFNVAQSLISVIWSDKLWTSG